MLWQAEEARKWSQFTFAVIKQKNEALLDRGKQNIKKRFTGD